MLKKQDYIYFFMCALITNSDARELICPIIFPAVKDCKDKLSVRLERVRVPNPGETIDLFFDDVLTIGDSGECVLAITSGAVVSHQGRDGQILVERRQPLTKFWAWFGREIQGKYDLKRAVREFLDDKSLLQARREAKFPYSILVTGVKISPGVGEAYVSPLVGMATRDYAPIRAWEEKQKMRVGVNTL